MLRFCSLVEMQSLLSFKNPLNFVTHRGKLAKNLPSVDAKGFLKNNNKKKNLSGTLHNRDRNLINFFVLEISRSFENMQLIDVYLKEQINQCTVYVDLS